MGGKLSFTPQPALCATAPTHLPQDIVAQLLPFLANAGHFRVGKYLRSLHNPPVIYRIFEVRVAPFEFPSADYCLSFAYLRPHSKDFFYFHFYKTLLPDGSVRMDLSVHKYLQRCSSGQNLLLFFSTGLVYDYQTWETTCYII